MGQDDDDDWIVRGVTTNLRATWQTYLRGRRRMWIETVFRDWQSGGFHLDRCGMTDRDRVARVLLPLAIAYLWLVSLGRWVVQKGDRRLIDDGTAQSWHFSLFQRGVRAGRSAWRAIRAPFRCSSSATCNRLQR